MIIEDEIELIKNQSLPESPSKNRIKELSFEKDS